MKQEQVRKKEFDRVILFVIILLAILGIATVIFAFVASYSLTGKLILP